MRVIDQLTKALELLGIACQAAADVVRLVDADLVFEPRVFDLAYSGRYKLIQLDILSNSNRVAPRFVVE